MKRALTGIKPTGDVHLGNLLGSILPALELQEQHQAFYFIADYHALTTMHDPVALRAATRQVAATWLALGLDPERTVLFRQSDIPVVCELTWILSCFTPFGQLERGHAVKSARQGGLDVNVGTWLYPMLMSADILLYDTHVVPVGRDQKQHVEITRDVAIKMNHRFGDDTLVVPEVSIRDEVGVIPGLDGQKMSKSYGNVIPIWLPAKQLRKVVMRIVTDSLGVDDVKDPDTCNVFNLYKLVAPPDKVAELRGRYVEGGYGYGHAKQDLFEALDALLAEPRDLYNEWLAHPDRLDDVLEHGATRAREAAHQTLDRLRERVGLR